MISTTRFGTSDIARAKAFWGPITAMIGASVVRDRDDMIGYRGAEGSMLLIGIPLTGWLATPKFLSEEEAMAGLTLFGAFPLPGAPSLGLPMKGIHEIGSNLGIALLALHVLAALKHHFINRDDVLRRMLPFRRTG